MEAHQLDSSSDAPMSAEEAEENFSDLELPELESDTDEAVRDVEMEE